jgi:hypothetical protein
MTNFLLAITFAADSTRIAGFASTGNDVTSRTNGTEQF